MMSTLHCHRTVLLSMFTRQADPQPDRIFAVNSDGSGEHQLIADGCPIGDRCGDAIEGHPWSPHGHQIAFIRAVWVGAETVPSNVGLVAHECRGVRTGASAGDDRKTQANGYRDGAERSDSHASWTPIHGHRFPQSRLPMIGCGKGAERQIGSGRRMSASTQRALVARACTSTVEPVIAHVQYRRGLPATEGCYSAWTALEQRRRDAGGGTGKFVEISNVDWAGLVGASAPAEPRRSQPAAASRACKALTKGPSIVFAAPLNSA